MKTIQTKEMREVVITKYIAKDGKEFDLKSECIAYEESLDNELLDRYNAIPRTEAHAEDCYLPTWYTSEDEVHVIRIRNKQDVDTINEWKSQFSNDTIAVSYDDIGRLVMLVYDSWGGFEESEYCDVIFYDDYLKTVQEWYARLCEKN